MANVLIVHAHPEPKSFSSALAHTAREALAGAGHRVAFSDLYAMGFDPVSSRSNFVTVADGDYFKPQIEERHATAHGGFAPLLETEMQKLESADLIVFSFPLWWFSLPAMLKGWIDRVFAYGRIYGEGRWYEQGIGRGKRALAVLTTGSPATAYGRDGLHASLESILTPLHHGVFWFNGFTSLRPFVAWSPAHLTPAAREAELLNWRKRLATLFDEPGAVLSPAVEYHAGTWRDQAARFLVTVRRRNEAPAAGAMLSPDDLAALRKLRRSGRLLRVFLTPAGAESWRGFFEFRAASAAEALAQCRDLPLARHCEFECVGLDPSLEDSLSPFWATA
ncbi:MAG TPA: NAD(P)H-dependent oxidoreductase [Opitutaceae bacterium]